MARGAWIGWVGSAGLVGKLLHYQCDRFELVFSPPVYEHEGRRYQEVHRGRAVRDAEDFEAGDFVIIAAPIPLTRAEIIERAAKALRSRLADASPLRAWEEDAIELAVSCVVDDVMGEQP